MPYSQKKCWSASWKRSDYFQIFSKYTSKLMSPQQPSKREPAALWDMCPGAVLWLPPKNSITPSNLLKFPEMLALSEKAFNHPVLVLDVSITGPEDAVVTFAPMTTGTSMRRHDSYMKIFHSNTKNKVVSDVTCEETEVDSETSTAGAACFEPAQKEQSNHCDNAQYSAPPLTNDDILYLEKETKHRSMTEESYVNLSTIYSTDWQELQCYAVGQKPDGNRHRLQKSSFEKIMKRMRPKLDISGSSWVDSDKLWETFYENYIKPLEGK